MPGTRPDSAVSTYLREQIDIHVRTGYGSPPALMWLAPPSSRATCADGNVADIAAIRRSGRKPARHSPALRPST